MSNENKPELPRFNGRPSDVITAESRHTLTIAVADTPTQLNPIDGVKFTRIGIENPASNGQSVFIGGEDVENGDAALAAGQTRGRELAPSQTRDEDTTLAPWAIAPSGETVIVVVEFIL